MPISRIHISLDEDLKYNLKLHCLNNRITLSQFRHETLNKSIDANGKVKENSIPKKSVSYTVNVVLPLDKEDYAMLASAAKERKISVKQFVYECITEKL